MYINRPFKSGFFGSWGLSLEDRNNPKSKLIAPTKEIFVEGYNYLSRKREMIVKSFLVGGITTTDPAFLQDDDFLIIDNVCMDLKMEDDPFLSLF